MNPQHGKPQTPPGPGGDSAVADQEMLKGIPSVPSHQADQLLRQDDHEWVLRTQIIVPGFAPEPALTRIAKSPLPSASERRLRAAIFDGAPLDERLPWELRRILDGYRVRAALPADWSLPRVLAVGVAEGGRPYVSRKWVDGLPLGVALAAVPALDHVLSQLIALLEALHDRCVVVQDLKPDNLVLDARSRVWLVDIESLRAAPLGAIPCTHFTPRYAAPEQLRGRTSALASDLYAFGKLALHVSKGALPARWVELVDRCLRDDPLARPTAAQALDWLNKGTPFPPVGLENRPLDATVRVPEPVDVVPIGLSRLNPPTEPVQDSTLRVPSLPGSAAAPPPPAPQARSLPESFSLPPPPPELSTVVPAADQAAEPIQKSALAARSRPMSRAMRVGAWGVSLVAVLATVYAGMALERSMRAQSELARASDRLVAAARTGLKEHKVLPQKNNDQELARWWVVARQAAVLDPDADSLGVLALATVWGQRWHRTGATWDSRSYALAEALTVQANDAGRTPEGLLAQGLLSAALCRLGPARHIKQACSDATRQLDRAARISADWMVVEARWGSVTVTNANARRALQRGDMAEAAHAASQSLRQCKLAEDSLPAAPVNGVELMEDCSWAAGVARDRDDWVRWSTSWLVAKGGADPSLLERLTRSAAPECANADYTSASSPSGMTDGSWASWCTSQAELVRQCASQRRSSRPGPVALPDGCPKDLVSVR